MPDESRTAGAVELMPSFVRAFARDDLDAQISLLARDAVWEGLPQAVETVDGARDPTSTGAWRSAR
jgi:hypothetical protein